jgi:hypothetical protein
VQKAACFPADSFGIVPDGYFQSLDAISADFYEIGAQESSSTVVNAIIIFA